MLTYVINTSENRPFDSTLLFDLSGYNKIRWMQCPLDKIGDCVDEIYVKQNVLGADKFRIAVIVDFYSFDKIRLPYGRKGYGLEVGVDLGLYLPYIEVYLLDNLRLPLEKRDLYSSDFEVYYIQNEKSERYELFENAENQLETVLSGVDIADKQDSSYYEDVSDCVFDVSNPENHLTQESEEKPAPKKSAKKEKTPVDEWSDGHEEIKPYKGAAACKHICRVCQKSLTCKNSGLNGDALEKTQPCLPQEKYSNKDFLVDIVHLAEAYPTEIPPDLQNTDELRDENEIFPVLPKGIEKETVKGIALPFKTINKINTGDKVRLIKRITENGKTVGYENHDQVFTVTDLYRPDGTQVKSVDDPTRNFFARIPSHITVHVGDVLIKCDPMYTSFSLYCAPEVSLRFNMSDYPYGEDAMTFTRFRQAFLQRSSIKTDMRRHFYPTTYGGGASRAALEALSLSLYLIRMYEREELSSDNEVLEIQPLDAAILKDVLVGSWCKVNSAKLMAKKTGAEYYSLDQDPPEKPEGDKKKEKTPEDGIAEAKHSLPKDVTNTGLDPEELYESVIDFASRGSGEVKERNRIKFNKIMSEYLRRRDETRESDVEAEFMSMKNSGFLRMTEQCPSKEEYNYYVDRKEREISELFERTLAADYIQVDYTEEQEKAEKAYADYKKAKACMQRSLWGDLIFMLLAVGIMILPYGIFQLSSYTVGKFSAVALGLFAAAFFSGLFILAVILQLLPQISRMNDAKRRLRSCYINCCAKEEYSFSALKRRYEEELLDIEQARYEIRQLKRLFDLNTEKEHNVTLHHEMLEKLEDCISSILNNLDVEPTFDPYDAIDDEFDLNKPFRSRENRVYQIFSIETIERMFPKKGSD